MAIFIHEKEKEFHIQNDHMSYVIKVLRSGHLGQIYFGRKIEDRDNFDHLVETAHRDMAPCLFEGETTFSLEHLKQEYGFFGRGDMRYPAFEIERENGSTIVDVKYVGFRLFDGKPKLEGLPCTYVEDKYEAMTLEIDLEDSIVPVRITLRYTIWADKPVLARSVYFTNLGDESLKLKKAMSFCLDLPDCNYEMVDLTGAWARERHVKNHALHQGVQSIHSMRGHSSHQFNPFLALKRRGTNESFGEVFGMSLVYSGNFLGQVEVDTMDTTRVLMGIHPQNFCWDLAGGTSFQTPEVVMVYAQHGLNGMSQVYHELYRTRLARGYWRDRERPILINNWEATYMDFNEEKIVTIAKKAKQLGIELFVLDDGWFGTRNSDTSSLGDWYVNTEKLPNGIIGLSKRIKELGMDFGLWFEPEMVSKNSELYRAHPDWILGSEERFNCLGRHQYVLDFSKPEVVSYISDLVENIIREGEVSYIKWDMNRSISDLFSNGRSQKEQGMVYHKHILGIYQLYERLTTQFPTVLFESCASGGARFDPGILYYAPQGWASDDTDGMERIKIQYGTSYVYPVSAIGSHVSAIPNHQTYRNVPIETRAAVAYFGTFGYELDLNQLSEEEQAAVAEQVKFMKKHRKLIQKGTFYRLRNPFEEEGQAAWIIVSEDKQEAIVGYFRMIQPINCGFMRLPLQGLDSDREYEVEGFDYLCRGDELMNIGLILSDKASGVRSSEVPQGDYQSRIFMINAV